MKIQFVSDLHLEFSENRTYLAKYPLEVKGDILLIAGDTAYLDLPDSDEDTYSQYTFWDWASEHYRQVIVCFGNHDFYGYYDLATMTDGYCKEIRPNVHAYYNSVVYLDDIEVIVSTLWAHIEPYNAYMTERGVNDFYRIKYNGHRLSSDDFNHEHEISRQRYKWCFHCGIGRLHCHLRHRLLDLRSFASKHRCAYWRHSHSLQSTGLCLPRRTPQKRL